MWNLLIEQNITYIEPVYFRSMVLIEVAQIELFTHVTWARDITPPPPTIWPPVPDIRHREVHVGKATHSSRDLGLVWPSSRDLSRALCYISDKITRLVNYCCHGTFLCNMFHSHSVIICICNIYILYSYIYMCVFIYTYIGQVLKLGTTYLLSILLWI